MDRTAPEPPQRRDIMYCHQCENEWYRDEHGLQCPECHSEFCEIIESDQDPREDEAHIPADSEDAWDAPDPDEDDIDHFHWQENGPGEPPGGRLRATLNRTISINPEQAQPGQGVGLSGLIGNALHVLLGGLLQPPQQQNAQTQDEHDDGRPQSAPGSPRAEQEQGDGRSFTRHIQGPGYSFTMTTSSSNNLFPRNANAPQPFQNQPDNMDDMMRQMLMNIGVFAPGMQGPGVQGPGAQGPGTLRGGLRMGPGGFAFTPEIDQQGGPGGPMPFPAGLFQLLGMPFGGQHGDAVYSQEALDRIISQLMEQHQTGNAPGPASEAAIKSLPKRPIEEKDFGDSGTADCSICMDSVQLGDVVTVLPCEHWFHGDCIKAWLGEHDTCPHCRQGIMPRGNRNSSQARESSQMPLNDLNSSANTRTDLPGAFPLATQESTGVVPTSPTIDRQTHSQSGGGVFDRMREAFGSGGSSGEGSSGDRRS